MGKIILPTDYPKKGQVVDNLVNFHKVDSKLFRGAQPNAPGIEQLKNKSVVLVINLRQNDVWPEEEQLLKAAGIGYVNVPLCSLSAPKLETVNKILSTVAKAPGPVFIHCQYGCDRTGTIVACYRIRVHSMTNEAALKDAEDHGMAEFEVGMKKFILTFK